ncbi:hypothetical protein BsWGS_28992 [Bradybaena similaris]
MHVRRGEKKQTG